MRHFARFGQHLFIPVLFMAAGGGIDLYVRGAAQVMNEWTIFIIYTLVPLGGFAFLLFLWNLWLAPYRLLSEASPSAEIEKEANWKEWAKVPKFTAWQAARLWVNLEPDFNTDSGPSYPVFRRLKYDATSGKVKAIPRLIHGQPLEVDRHTEFDRDELVRYAKENGEKPKFLFP